ncbi:MAG: DUF86 domain-containing protein [Rhodobacteraceae bacterium]|nr:DUF86 domain-containing protein [Paracoccaceae bacterium]
MRRDPRILLADIEAAASAIEAYTEGMNDDVWARSGMAQAAVERKFEIIGEAMNRLHKDAPDLAKRIPGLRDVVDFRNLLSHGYDAVDSELVWTYAKNDLIDLRRSVRKLLAELDQPHAKEMPGSAGAELPSSAEIPDPYKPPSPFD